jgi:hypothetical protein
MKYDLFKKNNQRSIKQEYLSITVGIERLTLFLYKTENPHCRAVLGTCHKTPWRDLSSTLYSIRWWILPQEILVLERVVGIELSDAYREVVDSAVDNPNDVANPNFENKLRKFLVQDRCRLNLRKCRRRCTCSTLWRTFLIVCAHRNKKSSRRLLPGSLLRIFFDGWLDCSLG